ncbi:ATP-dependent DNA ligase [Agromyces sp. NPDC058110]|uniref:DUF7882 family protein n=1 Tax=Agromyces sp. NPDC058110 TaxID=3346345 RepID=UPI0036D8FF94
MGRFHYDGLVKIDFEDRTLAHLQVVIGAKVRRGESFSFTWRDDPSIGDGRTTVWIHPRAQILYKFYGGRAPQINRAWVDALMYSANSPAGLHVVPEPMEARPASEARE